MHTDPSLTQLVLKNMVPKRLERDLPSGGVLSVVLNVNPASDANQGDGLRLRARALMSTLNAPDTLVQAVMDNLNQAQRSTRSRVYFLWEAHQHLKQCFVDAQFSLPESARFGAPDLEPLHFALESGQRVAIALVDSEWGRIFSVHLGVIKELIRLENVMEHDDSFREHLVQGQAHPALEDTDPHKDSGRRLLSRDTDNDHLGDRAAQQDRRFYRALAARLGQLGQVGAFERLVIAGTERARASLSRELTPALKRAHSGEVLARGDASASSVLELASETLGRVEREAEQTLLNEAQERGVHGLAETLKAVQAGRVSELLVEGDGSGVRIWRDAAGTVSSAPPKRVRKEPDTQSLTLRDVLSELRERYGLQMRFLSGEQARRLHDRMGGLAGLLRY